MTISEEGAREKEIKVESNKTETTSIGRGGATGECAISERGGESGGKS